MKASSSILSFLVIYGSCIATSRADAAPTATTNHHLRHRTKSSSSSSTATHRQLLPNNKNNKKCSILAVQSEGKNGNPDETSFECQGSNGLTKQIKTNSSDMAKLKTMLTTGKLVSSVTEFNYDESEESDDEIFIPPGLINNIHTPAPQATANNNARQLSTSLLTGTKPILVVRVTDSEGRAVSDTSEVISTNIFGDSSSSDAPNLKSQLEECSQNLITVTTGPQAVLDVTIPISLSDESNSRTAIRNSITTATQTALGHELPGPYHHVIYIVEGCYHDCGYMAYAYINSWNVVVLGTYYNNVGLMLHELGHNFNLAHSGTAQEGGDSDTYGDFTGVMGGLLVDKMCYNAAKNWQLPWYDASNGKMLLDPSGGATTFTTTELDLVGIAEYDAPTTSQPVTVKLETGTDTDYFIGFNRATGINSDVIMGSDEVTVTTSGNNGEGYSQSYLHATLMNGEAHVITNFGGSGDDLVVKVININTSAVPGIAAVCIGYGEDCGDTTYTAPTAPIVDPPSPIVLLDDIDESTLHESIAPVCQTYQAYSYDSDYVTSASTVVSYEAGDAPWIQLDLSNSDLDANAKIVLSSEDGSTLQQLDQEGLANSNGWSAILPVSSVTVTLVTNPMPWEDNTSSLLVSGFFAGVCEDDRDETAYKMCGGVENRVSSTDVRIGRFNGCTAWLVSEDVVVYAGHCGKPYESARIHFTFDAAENPVTVSLADQYAVVVDSHRYDNSGTGSDWAAIRVRPNSETGELPGVAQKEKCLDPNFSSIYGGEGCPSVGKTNPGWFTRGTVPATTGGPIRVTGYGIPDNRPQRTDNGYLVQSTTSNTLKYHVDTEGGSSGSPVIDESTNEDLVVAIHTHGACSASTTSGNVGTRIDKLDLATHINFLTQACNQDSHCSDNIFCNGEETCNADGKCEYGPPETCEDFDQCTNNICTEGVGQAICSDPVVSCPTSDCGTGECINLGFPNIGSWAGQGGGGCQYTCGATKETYLNMVDLTTDVSSVFALISANTQPDRVERLGSNAQLKATKKAGQYLGQRISGLLAPTTTADYTFWITCDDRCELYLSTDENMSNKVKICEVATSQTSETEWTRYAEQKSAKIPLVDGQLYYYEAVMKETLGGDHMGVAWGTGTDPQPVLIPASASKLPNHSWYEAGGSQSPSKAPSSSPVTSSPITSDPTLSPSKSPVTSSPITSDPTLSPSKSPETSSPSKSPSLSPFMSPTIPLDGFCSDNPTNICSSQDLSQCACSSTGRRDLQEKKTEDEKMIITRMLAKPKCDDNTCRLSCTECDCGQQQCDPTLCPDSLGLDKCSTDQPTGLVASPPSISPSTSSPTSSPSVSPTHQPTSFQCKCIYPTSQPTSPPTFPPVTSEPAPAPGPEPAPSPTENCEPKGVSCTLASVNCCNGCSGGKPSKRVCR